MVPPLGRGEQKDTGFYYRELLTENQQVTSEARRSDQKQIWLSDYFTNGTLGSCRGAMIGKKVDGYIFSKAKGRI